MLPLPQLADHTVAVGVPAWERRALPYVFKGAAFYLRRRLAIGAKKVEADIVATRALFAELSKTLENSPFLVGDTFTAADLTFASLAAPVLLPLEYGSPLPRPDEVGPVFRALCEELRATPAGASAMRLFREERARRPAS